MGYRHTFVMTALIAGLLLVGCDGGNGGSNPDGGDGGDSGDDSQTAPASDSDTPSEATGSGDKAGDNTNSGDSAASTAYPVADSPRQAVVNLADAFEAGDEDAFMRVVHQTEAHPNLARSVFHFGHAATTVRDAIVDLHGRSGLELLDDEQALQLPYPLGQRNWRDRMTIRKLTDDKAEAHIEGDTDDATGLPLVKVDGHWRVDLFTAIEAKTEAGIDQARRQMQAMTDQLTTLRDEITEMGLSLEQIGAAWGERLSDRVTEGRRWLADVIAPDGSEQDADQSQRPTP